MGMCKGCKQIFKTEVMKYNYCVDCQSSEEFINNKDILEQKYTNKKEDKNEDGKSSKFMWWGISIFGLFMFLFVIPAKCVLPLIGVTLFVTLAKFIISYLIEKKE